MDSHCASGLKCFQRNGKTTVPGCQGGGSGDISGHDFCIKPSDFQVPAGSTTLVYLGSNAKSMENPLNQCQGDCDNDSHCASDLKCFQRTGKTTVPGCQGGGSGDVSGH